MDRRPDRGCGLNRSLKFPVLTGYGPVRSRSFSGPRTGLPNTRQYSPKSHWATTLPHPNANRYINCYLSTFALSMSEALPVEGASLQLDIPRDKQFRTKINQRPQNPPPKEFFKGVIN